MTKRFVDTFVVMNDQGLHTRPSTELVKCSTAFSSQVTLSCNGVSVNGKSLLGILILAAAKGAEVTVEAVGDDAEEAVRAILEQASQRFGIMY